MIWSMVFIDIWRKKTLTSHWGEELRGSSCLQTPPSSPWLSNVSTILWSWSKGIVSNKMQVFTILTMVDIITIIIERGSHLFVSKKRSKRSPVSPFLSAVEELGHTDGYHDNQNDQDDNSRCRVTPAEPGWRWGPRVHGGAGEQGGAGTPEHHHKHHQWTSVTITIIITLWSYEQINKGQYKILITLGGKSALPGNAAGRNLSQPFEKVQKILTKDFI